MSSDKSRVILYAGKELPDYVKGTKVTFHFKTVKRSDDDEEIVIDDSKKQNQPMELLIGKQFKLNVWEELIKTMRVGEVSWIKVHESLVMDYPFVAKCYRQFVKKKLNPQLEEEEKHQSHCCGMTMKKSFGYEDLDDLSQKPRDLEFTIEVVKAESPDKYEKEVWELDNEEKFPSIDKFRQEGNRLYAEGKYQEAAEYYQKSLGIIEQLILREKPGDEEWTKLDQMKVPLLSNFAQCKLIAGDYYAVIEHTTEVLKRDENNIKALFRRAKANSAVWNVQEAREDFNKLLQLDSALEKVVLNELKNLDVRSKIKDEEDKKKLQGKLFK